MFKTKEEADLRRNSPKNFLSPNYEPPTLDAWDGVPAVIPTPPSGPKPQKAEVDEPEDDRQLSPPEETIDHLLNGTVDPYKIRKMNGGRLQGMIDAQVAIGTTSEILGPKMTGALYSMSKEQSRAYQNGMGSTDQYGDAPHNPSRYERMKDVKETLAELAAKRLKSALHVLTREKIEQEKFATGISRVAKDMAVIIDKVTKDKIDEGTVHFHIFRPEMKTVTQYNTVHVSAPQEKQQTEGRLD